MSAPASVLSRLRPSVGGARVGDIVLVVGVFAVVAALIFPLPSWLIDAMVALSLLMGIGLLLLAIYVPAATAFTSFPSVLLLSTLFRLALSIAITRKILLEAEGGRIVEAFGNFVVGGNLIVGVVVFLIITVVQFIVVAKGAERVAEVSARFTLDAMPGKQLSIDSDLRSGLIEKDEARRRRRLLEVESQMHGSLDGAMKYVKGDAIAGIVIIIINLLAGLGIGMLQLDMSFAEAAHRYSVLTIGDGLVSQIPAMLNAMAAGLLVTRITGDDQDADLGQSIARQISGYPRVTLIAGVVALALALTPGFPWPVFVAIGAVLLAVWLRSDGLRMPWIARLLRRPTRGAEDDEAATAVSEQSLDLPLPLCLRVGVALAAEPGMPVLRARLAEAVEARRRDSGVPVPDGRLVVDPSLDGHAWRLDAHGTRIAAGLLEPGRGWRPDSASVPDPRFVPALAGRFVEPGDGVLDGGQLVALHVEAALARNLPLFIGIQETANLVNRLSRDYPDLTRETLRVLAPQRIADVLRRLAEEGVSIRHARDVFEALADAAAREKDVLMITEHVRVGLRRHLCGRWSERGRPLRAVLAHPELEDRLRQSVRVGSAGPQLAVDPDFARRVVAQVRTLCVPAAEVVLLCSLDVRRHLRKLVEIECFEVAVLSFQELVPELALEPVAQLEP